MTPSAVKSATQSLSQQAFISRTSSTTLIASAICQAFFPATHKAALRHFKAGKYFEADTGPWLGRALGYKVPTTTHPDEGDSGTTFITSVGCYSGGCLEFLDLELTFAYRPGHMALGDFGNFFHRVSAWKDAEPDQVMKDLMQRHGLTSGRSFLVMFNKSETDERLKDKPSGWGLGTRFGADEVAPKIK